MSRSRKSSWHLLVEYYERTEALSSRTSIGRRILPREKTRWSLSRLQKLSHEASELRDSIQTVEEGHPDKFKVSKIAESVIVVAARGTLLCNIFAEAERKMELLDLAVDDVASTGHMVDSMRANLMQMRASGDLRREDVSKVEADLGEWVGQFAALSRRLHCLGTN
ncbi:hypothetical protein NM208_g6060 [Fusarium decemcellulare]|uniref:Uncharacterized protein n=1 Tax=Fusarium decemcellulare TaxID=57161 RepID=A0ACC1SEI5_9HYPO|nr:hypothetical protein NM208_g6060 [Fusarium decemcellulare]